MQIDEKKKLYVYSYTLVDRHWNEIIDSGEGEVVADDMKEAVDVAHSFIQLKYFKVYEYPKDIDIDIYKIEKINE